MSRVCQVTGKKPLVGSQRQPLEPPHQASLRGEPHEQAVLARRREALDHAARLRARHAPDRQAGSAGGRRAAPRPRREAVAYAACGDARVPRSSASLPAKARDASWLRRRAAASTHRRPIRRSIADRRDRCAASPAMATLDVRSRSSQERRRTARRRRVADRGSDVAWHGRARAGPPADRATQATSSRSRSSARDRSRWARQRSRCAAPPAPSSSPSIARPAQRGGMPHSTPVTGR